MSWKIFLSIKIKKSIVVIPENNPLIKDISSDLKTVIQPVALGTGDAVKKATQQLKNFTGIILVCFADTPFLTSETIKKIVRSFNDDTKLVITGFKKHEKNNRKI